MSTAPKPEPTTTSTTPADTPEPTPAATPTPEPAPIPSATAGTAAQPPQPKGPSVLDKLMMIIQTATAVASAIPQTSEYARLALQVEGIASTAIQAHEQISGQPFDASLLKSIELIP